MTTGQIAWNDVEAGQELPGYSILLTFEKVAMTPFATWDFFPGHHDPAAARAQGQKDIFLNTIALQGFADRVATDWAGPETFIARRKMAMTRSAFAGDTLTASGRVTGKSGPDERKLFLAILLATQDGPVCTAETTIILPRRGN
jgi:acyl dehydratase